MRQVSQKRSQRLRLYLQVRKEYLEAHPYDQVWLLENVIPKYKCSLEEAETMARNGVIRGVPLATEIHHRRGRVGSLLTDTRYFYSVSSKTHAWIHNNPGIAYDKGYMLFR